jgi:hypothetical protein
VTQELVVKWLREIWHRKPSAVLKKREYFQGLLHCSF